MEKPLVRALQWAPHVLQELTKKEKGVYCLTPETVVESSADKEGQPFMLCVLSPDRELFVSALDEGSRRKWLDAI